ncbi:Hsp20/alpha crystallin family protein [Neobacillus vireti]|uniref:Spore coat protein n=1 Tax=Neobacillus vireti LMG 21834 TaxID=1131730 RepID=A0AB94ILI6_9BACI|nr:Hsp20/alpha crystallin family protein [Neobacillus vireti]ETI67892.1 spore coat protein [Neobacillus vireti LMG 21834]KLT17314.1 spore coat protein [Neobacillus vireti]
MFPWNMFPFGKDMKESMQKMKPEEINNFVQDIIGKIMPGNMQGMMNPQEMFNGFQNTASQQRPVSGVLESTAFETHDYVFVRIPLKNEEWIKMLRLYHTSNQLIIEHIPEHNDSNTITLPAIVKRKGAIANYKDGILEVKIPKNIDMQYSQIDVTEIL